MEKTWVKKNITCTCLPAIVHVH